MKTLVNKHNPKIRIIAPEIKIEELPHDYYAFFSKKDWTLVEEEENISFADRLKERLENMTQEEFEKAMNEMYVEGDESPTLEEYLKAAYHSPIEEEPENLEKQKEQEKCPEYCVRSHCIGCSIYEKQKKQKPVEWSEEDENNTGWLIAYLEGKNVYHSDNLHKSVIKWLRSIRDRLKSICPQPKRKQSPALKKIMDNLTEEKLAKTRAEMKTVKEEPEGWNKADCVKEIPFSLIYEEFAEHWRLGKAVEPGDYYIPISRLRWGIKGNLEEIPSNVDLEKEIKNKRTILLDLFGPMNGEQCLAIKNFARHFYELGLKARK